MKKILGALSVLLISGAAYAQPDQGRGPDGQGGGPPGMDQGGMRRGPIDRIQEELNVDEAKWNTVEPLIREIMQLKRDVNGNMMMGRGQGGPPGMNQGGGPQGDRGQQDGGNRRGPGGQRGQGQQGAGPQGGGPDGQGAGPQGGGPDGQGPQRGPQQGGRDGQGGPPQGGPGGGFGGPGGPDGGGDQQPSEAQQAVTDLQNVLEQQDASTDDIVAKMKTLRAARAAARAQLTKDQTELTGMLEMRQQAVLLTFGILE